MTETEFPERKMYWAPFGQHTRLILGNHIRHALVIILALLSIALTVDMVPQLDKLTENLSGLDALARVGWFILLRSADLMPRFIPLAAFLAVLWTEVTHTISRERLLVWNTGRSPFRCLVPVVLLALLFGALQFFCDAYLRPAAMAVQIEGHMGSKGEEFDRTLTKDTHWIAAGNDLLQARFEYGPPAVLRDLTLYRMNQDGRLREVINARDAKPDAEKNSWTLEDGSYWEIPAENASGAASVPLLSRGTKASAVKFDERQITLTVDPLWISVWGVPAQYLAFDTLRDLAQGTTPDDPRSTYVTHYQANFANALMPGAMALFAATLCMLILAYAAPLGLQLAMLPIGYVGHLAMKTFLLMGEFEYMPPLLAAWAAPLGLLAASGTLLLANEWRRHKT